MESQRNVSKKHKKKRKNYRNFNVGPHLLDFSQFPDSVDRTKDSTTTDDVDPATEDSKKKDSKGNDSGDQDSGDRQITDVPSVFALPTKVATTVSLGTATALNYVMLHNIAKSKTEINQLQAAKDLATRGWTAEGFATAERNAERYATREDMASINRYQRELRDVQSSLDTAANSNEWSILPKHTTADFTTFKNTKTKEINVAFHDRMELEPRTAFKYPSHTSDLTVMSDDLDIPEVPDRFPLRPTPRRPLSEDLRLQTSSSSSEILPTQVSSENLASPSAGQLRQRTFKGRTLKNARQTRLAREGKLVQNHSTSPHTPQNEVRTSPRQISSAPQPRKLEQSFSPESSISSQRTTPSSGVFQSSPVRQNADNFISANQSREDLNVRQLRSQKTMSTARPAETRPYQIQRYLEEEGSPYEFPQENASVAQKILYHEKQITQQASEEFSPIRRVLIRRGSGGQRTIKFPSQAPVEGELLTPPSATASEPINMMRIQAESPMQFGRRPPINVAKLRRSPVKLLQAGNRRMHSENLTARFEEMYGTDNLFTNAITKMKKVIKATSRKFRLKVRGMANTSRNNAILNTEEFDIEQGLSRSAARRASNLRARGMLNTRHTNAILDMEEANARWYGNAVTQANNKFQAAAETAKDVLRVQAAKVSKYGTVFKQSITPNNVEMPTLPSASENVLLDSESEMKFARLINSPEFESYKFNMIGNQETGLARVSQTMQYVNKTFSRIPARMPFKASAYAFDTADVAATMYRLRALGGMLSKAGKVVPYLGAALTLAQMGYAGYDGFNMIRDHVSAEDFANQIQEDMGFGFLPAVGTDVTDHGAFGSWGIATTLIMPPLGLQLMAADELDKLTDRAASKFLIQEGKDIGKVFNSVVDHPVTSAKRAAEAVGNVITHPVQSAVSAAKSIGRSIHNWTGLGRHPKHHHTETELRLTGNNKIDIESQQPDNVEVSDNPA